MNVMMMVRGLSLHGQYLVRDAANGSGEAVGLLLG